MSTEEIAAQGGRWVWANRNEIADFLKRLYRWFRPEPPVPDRPGILIIGPGGTGKTTLARQLSGEYTSHLLEESWKYQESITEERYNLSDDPGVDVLVIPGQPARREASWQAIQAGLAAGRYRGVVFTTSYGYDSLAIGSYRQQALYAGDKGAFVDAYTADRRAEEFRIFDRLCTALTAAPNKVWLLTAVTKQDLWWTERDTVRTRYQGGEWETACYRVRSALGTARFRFEFAFVSLVIANWVDPEGDRLKPNTAGYDQEAQVGSLRRLLEMLDGLREWEGGS